ncbi:MAG: DNA mismatch repair protein MutT [Parachlamydia sp.]|nr:MAG: DNA mismatch repair protein MutT [Parachlamydia sp.]
MEKERPKIGIGVAVIKDQRVLLGKRLGSHGEGDWAFPGGHLEFGETPAECAQRELLEEAGLTATRMISGPWTNDIFCGTKHYITLFMIVTEFTGEPRVLEPHKCENWEWFAWENLPQPLFAPIQSLMNNVGIEWLKNQCVPEIVVI